MKRRTALSVFLLGTILVPVSVVAQSAPPSPTSTPTPVTTTSAVRAQPFTSFDSASPAVRDAVTTATASRQTAVASLEEAIRLGIVTPATIATSATSVMSTLPPSVEAHPAAVTRASNAILAESRATRATVLTPREAAITRLRQAQTEQERQRLVEELRVSSSQRLEAQREDARLVRDRIRQLRDLTTINRPSGN
jgi:hypothetical protein